MPIRVSGDVTPKEKTVKEQLLEEMASANSIAKLKEILEVVINKLPD